MDVASLCPLPVGVLWWQSPRRSLTVIVKMTFTLAGDEVALAEPQEALSLDTPSALGAGDELYCATDFVPRKARCDVLLTGHARAVSSSPLIPARVCVGDFEKRFFALAAEPSPSIPLSATYLRAGASSGSKAVSVAPLAPWSAARARLAGGAQMSAYGTPIAPLEADFDFGFFNAAPFDQQIEALQPSPVLLLEGLIVGEPFETRRRVQLPSERPRIYASMKGSGRASSLVEIPLCCDTLWIDTDRALCVTTWRGMLDVARADGGDEPSLLVSTMAPYGRAESLPAIEARMRRVERARAVEASDLARLAQDQVEEVDPEDEETRDVGALPPATPARGEAHPERGSSGSDRVSRPVGALGALGGLNAFRLGSQRSISISMSDDYDDSDESTAGGAEEIEPELAGAEEIEPDEEAITAAEEIEPEEILDWEEEATAESLVSEVTSAPVHAAAHASVPGTLSGASNPAVPKRRRLTFTDEEVTRPNMTLPVGAALPFQPTGAVRALTPVPPAPEHGDGAAASALPFRAPSGDRLPGSSPGAHPSTSVLPFSQPPQGLPFVRPPSIAGKEAASLPAMPQVSSGLPFARAAVAGTEEVTAVTSVLLQATPSTRTSARRATLVDSGKPTEGAPQAALPFVTPRAAADEGVSSRESSPPTSSGLPFVRPHAPSDEGVSSRESSPPTSSGLPFVRPPAPGNDASSIQPLKGAIPSPLPFLSPLSVAPADPPAVDPPRPEDPPAAPLLPLPAYAAIQVELWEEAAPVEEIFERHGIDEMIWRDNERRRAEALADASARGDSDVALALADALNAARTGRTSASPPTLTLDDYAALRAEIDAAPEPGPILAKKGITEAQWQKVQRGFRRGAAIDSALAAQLRTKLTEAQRALAERAAAPPPKTKARPRRSRASARKAS